MTTLRERASELFDALGFVDLIPIEVETRIRIIERDLSDAILEGIKAELERHHTIHKCSCTNYAGQCSREAPKTPHICGNPSSACDAGCEENAAKGREIMNQPTAADALKAVRWLALANGNLPIAEGCLDILRGKRETSQALAITGGDEPTANKVTR